MDEYYEEKTWLHAEDFKNLNYLIPSNLEKIYYTYCLTWLVP